MCDRVYVRGVRSVTLMPSARRVARPSDWLPHTPHATPRLRRTITTQQARLCCPYPLCPRCGLPVPALMSGSTARSHGTTKASGVHMPRLRLAASTLSFDTTVCGPDPNPTAAGPVPPHGRHNGNPATPPSRCVSPARWTGNECTLAPAPAPAAAATVAGPRTRSCPAPGRGRGTGRPQARDRDRRVQLLTR